MRKHFKALSIAAITAAALATPALAQQDDRYPVEPNAAAVELGTGAVVGTVAGVGLYEGWFGATAAGTVLPATAAASAAAGGVVGVGAVAAVDGVIQPCRGLHAFFGLNKGACVNGQYVGYNPEPQARPVRHMRRVR